MQPDCVVILVGFNVPERQGVLELIIIVDVGSKDVSMVFG